MTTYTVAGEVEKVAHELIRGPHARLATAPIAYVFRNPPARSNGRDVWAKARKISGLAAFFAITPTPLEPPDRLDVGDPANDFYVVEVASTIWEHLNDRQKTALVDHELSHLDYLAGDPLKLTGHDLEEFVGVVRRHGLWSPAVFDLVAAGKTELEADITALGEEGGDDAPEA